MSPLETLPERVDVIERKLDTLTASVDRRFDELTASVDRRFDEVTAALVEQRQYTEFAFTRLEKRMLDGFAGMESRFDRMDSRFDRMDSRFDRMENRLERFERKLDQAIDGRRRARRPRRK